MSLLLPDAAAPRLTLAAAASPAPVPPFVIGRIPVAPKVALPVPSKLAGVVDVKSTTKVLAVASFAAESAAPVVLPVPPWVLLSGVVSPLKLVISELAPLAALVPTAA